MAKNSKLTSGVVSCYVRALYSVAHAWDCVSDLQQLLRSFSQAFSETPAFERALNDPRFNVPKLHGLLKQLFSKLSLSDSVASQKLMKNLLFVLAEHHRLTIFADLVEAFDVYVAKAEKQKVLQVTSVVPLAPAMREELKQLFSTHKDETIVVEEALDSSLLGGLIVQLGSRQIDMSLRHKLNSIKHTLKEVS